VCVCVCVCVCVRALSLVSPQSPQGKSYDESREDIAVCIPVSHS